MLYIRGDYTDASGVIENITWTPGESNQQSNELESGAFTAGVDKTINLDNTNKLATLSFDYKITSGEKLSVALLPNWALISQIVL